jgi:Gram-negative bacterial TonB protein C-terminal
MTRPGGVPLARLAKALLSLSCLSFTCAAVDAGTSHETRPALLQQGPRSLVNVLSAQRLLQKGQTDAVVKFEFYITAWGTVGSILTYGGSENSEALSQELVDNYERAEYIPAVYDGTKAGAFMAGTLLFAVTNGTPHLRIFLNQEPGHLKSGDDFISPQRLVPTYKTYKRLADLYHGMEPAVVAVQIQIDETGKLLDAKIVREHPPGSRFGMSVMENIKTVTFSPAFLHGKPIASSTTWTIPFRAYGRNNRWISSSRRSGTVRRLHSPA